MPVDKNEFYSKKKTAELLGVCVNTISNWEKKGILVAKRLGRKVYFLGEDLLNAFNNK